MAVGSSAWSVMGFALHNVVTMFVVLGRLMFDEGMGLLEDAYYLNQKETNELITRKELTKVVFPDMLVYGFDAERRNRTDFPITMQKIRNGYPQGWPSGVYGVSTMMTELKEMESNDPFEGYSGGYSFEVAQRSEARAIQG